MICVCSRAGFVGQALVGNPSVRLWSALQSAGVSGTMCRCSVPAGRFRCVADGASGCGLDGVPVDPFYSSPRAADISPEPSEGRGVCATPAAVSQTAAPLGCHGANGPRHLAGFGHWPTVSNSQSIRRSIGRTTPGMRVGRPGPADQSRGVPPARCVGTAALHPAPGPAVQRECDANRAEMSRAAVKTAQSWQGKWRFRPGLLNASVC